MKEGLVVSGPEVSRGPDVAPDSTTKKEIEGILETDLRVVVPEVDGTAFVLQRNAKDERGPSSPNFGALTPEAERNTEQGAKDWFRTFFERLSLEEMKNVEILVLASDAVLRSPEGHDSDHKRGLKTAIAVVKGIRKAMSEAGVDEAQLLNTSEFAEFAEPGGPVEFKELEALAMLSESPNFVKHLKEKYGTGEKFWINYELDTEKETREKMDAEGVDRIAERMRYFLSMLTKAAEQRHKEDPGKRLVIWAVSHYDAISPFVKKRVLGRPATEYLPVNAAAGITMEATRDGKVKTQLSGQEFDVDL